ncbi:MAG: hypothetical protein V3U43_05625 [Pseudomonadales bacterium]
MSPLLAACATHAHVEIETKHVLAKVHFGEDDLATMKAHYAHKNARKHHAGKGKNKSTPPGIAKKGTYPPGIRKQLQRGKGLPPGLNREPLPSDLEQRLTPLPKGYVRVRVGFDVVIMGIDNHIVVDIARDIGA